ncbi:MAG: methionine biosynthesis protein MetW [Geminicoccaceae bacterium]
MNNMVNGSLRRDLQLIADLIEPGARVLDVGSSDGALLAYLAAYKNIDARGLELSWEGVRASVARGVSVVQGDADQDLPLYPDNSFDYVILSQTLQAVAHPQGVLRDIMRIGRRGIVSLTNYGHWRARLSIAFRGRMPVARCLPAPWYATANIHPCTLADFEDLVSHMGFVIERFTGLDDKGEPRRTHAGRGLANLLSHQGLYLLARP